MTLISIGVWTFLLKGLSLQNVQDKEVPGEQCCLDCVFLVIFDGLGSHGIHHHQGPFNLGDCCFFSKHRRSKSKLPKSSSHTL